MASDQIGVNEVQNPRSDQHKFPESTLTSSASPGSVNTGSPLVDGEFSPKIDSRDDVQCDDNADIKPSPRPSIGGYMRKLFSWESSDWDWNYHVPRVNRPLTDYPTGYGQVAAFQDCDPSFLIFRKFGWLHNCLLLDLQDELQMLEHHLFRHNKEEADPGGDPRRLRSRRKDYEEPRSRKEILSEVKEKLAEYDELVLRTQKIQAIRRPSKKYQNAVWNYVTLKDKIVPKEVEWIKQRADLAAVSRDAEHGWPNSFIERYLRRLRPSLIQRFFQTEEQKEKSKGSEPLLLVSQYRINNVLKAILTLVASVQVLLALFTLFRLSPTKASEVRHYGNLQILVTFIFSLLFSASCVVFTKAKPQEIFAATAAYCAVMVVFLGSSTSNFAANS